MVEIRELNKEVDLSDLIKLSREFFQEYQEHHKDFFNLDNLRDEEISSYFSSFSENDKRISYVAVLDEKIIAYITVYIKEQADYWQIKKVGEISGLMVKKEYRRKGIARQLLAQAVDFFRVEGIKYYTVYTAVANHSGIDFYRNNGFLPLYTTLIGEI